MNMPEILAAFTAEPLFAATSKLLTHLGVKFSTQTEEPIPFLELYEEAATQANATIPKDVKAIFSRVENTYFIGTVTDDTLKGDNAAVDFKAEAARPKYEGMFVFAVEMKPGETLKRSEAAVLVRGINRVVKQQPATVLIVERVASGRCLVASEGQLTTNHYPLTTNLSVATCERTTYKQTWRPGERLGKVSILKGVNCLSPHRGHIGILESMNVKGCKTFDALYKQWMDVFSTSLLTKQFYREIQNWYFWALKKDQHVAFPNALDDDSDDEKYNAENIIRLITRLIFTWFMKEKGLVNKALFDTDFLSGALRHFNPEGRISDSKDPDAAHSCTYYRAILQNLFFATFNQEIPLRGFVNSTFRDTQHYNIKNYFRNAKLFTETDEQKIIGYFNGSPFVNGGLFECLDNVEQNGRVYSWDGFSNSVHFKDGSLKSALIPDCLFFGGETTTDLSEFFEKDKSAKSVKVRGIINILNDYVFTIEENTPFDEDVALDPELLGKVFENLLGCYNPETQQMARNATGSFYTPREIVNYMVKVTLKSCLKRACPKVVPAEIDALVEGVAELADMPSVKENAKDILTALFKAKILDPACGSGAFPMGIMSAMVEILRTVDPNNLHWHEVVLRESLDEAESIADIGDEEERAELRAQIEYDFKERVDHPDYARKLYVIEHCIFGSDIQPIAVQISRLRFFITLLCEQTKNDDPTKNYGITPLPNLESNFVAANSLLSIDLKDMRELLGQKKIVSLVKQLRGIRHQLFLPKTSDKKKRLQKKDEELRDAIAVAVEGLYDENIGQKCMILAGEIKRIDDELAKLEKDDFKDSIKEVEEVDLFGEKTVKAQKVVGKGNILLKKKKDVENSIVSLKNASRKERLLTDLKRLIAWNPFAFNVAETFLDPEWMFGVKDGFDIVIGNPPYISAPDQLRIPELKAQREVLAKDPRFNCLVQKWDLYIAFMELTMRHLLCDGGNMSMIVPYPLTNQTYAAKLRKAIVSEFTLLQIVDLQGEKIFENATVTNCIPLVAKLHGAACTPVGSDDPIVPSIPIVRIDADKSFHIAETLTLDEFMPDEKTCVWKTTREENLLARFRNFHSLGDYCYISVGMVLNADEKTNKGAFTKDDLISETKDIIHCREYIEGKDVGAYFIRNSRFLEYGTDRCPGQLRRQTFPELYNPPKIVVNQLGEICCTLDNNRLLHNHTVRACVLWYDLADVDNASISSSVRKFCHYPRKDLEKLSKDVSLRYLLGVLNSSYARFLARYIRGGDVCIYPEHLRSIPIPSATPAQQAEIMELVDRILEAKKEDSTADVSALAVKIDNLVFDLYGLTPEEREIVKGNGK